MSTHCDPFWHQEDTCRDCQPRPAQQDPAPPHECRLRDTIADCVASMSIFVFTGMVAAMIAGLAIVVRAIVVLL